MGQKIESTTNNPVYFRNLRDNQPT